MAGARSSRTIAARSSSTYFSTFFAAPIGVAAMMDPGLQTWLNAIYVAVHAISQDYCQDTVTLLCLLAMSGNFWDATA